MSNYYMWARLLVYVLFIAGGVVAAIAKNGHGVLLFAIMLHVSLATIDRDEAKGKK